jgi:hypothetical protein
LEDAENGLPMLARRLLHDVYLRLQAMNEQLLPMTAISNISPKPATPRNG